MKHEKEYFNFMNKEKNLDIKLQTAFYVTLIH
jgi:hypothetical protein